MRSGSRTILSFQGRLSVYFLPKVWKLCIVKIRTFGVSGEEVVLFGDLLGRASELFFVLPLTFLQNFTTQYTGIQ